MQGALPVSPTAPVPYLQVVVQARTQHVLEGSIDPASSPAIHVEHLEPETDRLFLILTTL